MAEFIFPINDYKDTEDQRFAMHCESEEEARIFLEFLDSIGRRWASGESYTNHNNYFYRYRDHGPCYYFNEGRVGSVESASITDAIILEFSDLLIDDSGFDVDKSALDEFLSAFEH